VISLVWLAGAVVAGAAALAIGWPAWRDYRVRESRDLNAERYLAWRGRAPRSSASSMSEGLTMAERRRIYLAAGLGLVGLVCLVLFFAVS
jgi:hypothetical protein